MSKFFNETIRARETVLTQGRPRQSASEQPGENPPVLRVQTPEMPDFLLQHCRSLTMPLADVIRDQFKGSTSLAPTQEAYRALRTRLMRLRQAQGLRSLVITSAMQGEGKTLTSFNLGLACAQLHGMRILLIDSDIRSSGLSRLLGSPAGPGLSEVLAGECDPAKAILATSSPNLYVMTSGTPSMPPAELLASSRWQGLMAWCSESFRLVVVDAPPVLDLSDVELISAGCDGIVMVVRAKQTRRDVLEKSATHLDAKKLLGVVYNGADGAGGRYNYPQVYGDDE